jgi:hypothetical protein
MKDGAAVSFGARDQVLAGLMAQSDGRKAPAISESTAP